MTLMRGVTMASGFPADIIKCRACGARDITVTDRVRSDAIVSCSQCGTVLWTWPEFLNRIGAIVGVRGATAEGSMSRLARREAEGGAKGEGLRLVSDSGQVCPGTGPKAQLGLSSD